MIYARFVKGLSVEN